MLRGSDIIGLPVLSWPHLKRMGKVREVRLDFDGLRVCGLELDSGGWLQPARILDFDAVRAVTETHVLAVEAYLTESEESHCCQGLHGRPVLATTGEELGRMDDFHFVPEDGRVALLQVSRGLVDDLLYGKELVVLNGPVVAGEAAIMLQDPGDLPGGALP